MPYTIHQIINCIQLSNWEQIFSSRDQWGDLFFIKQLISNHNSSFTRDLFLQETAIQGIKEKDISPIIMVDPYVGIGDQWVACSKLIAIFLEKQRQNKSNFPEKDNLEYEFTEKLFQLLPSNLVQLETLKSNLGILNKKYLDFEINKHFNELYNAADAKLNKIHYCREKLKKTKELFTNIKQCEDEEPYKNNLERINKKIKELRNVSAHKKTFDEYEIEELTETAAKLSQTMKIYELYKLNRLLQGKSEIFFPALPVDIDSDDISILTYQTQQLNSEIEEEIQNRESKGRSVESIFELFIRLEGIRLDLQELNLHDPQLDQHCINNKYSERQIHTLKLIKKQCDFLLELLKLTDDWKRCFERYSIKLIYENKVIDVNQYKNKKTGIIEFTKILSDSNQPHHPIKLFLDNNHTFQKMLKKIVCADHLLKTLNNPGKSITSRIFAYYHQLHKREFINLLGRYSDTHYKKIQKHATTITTLFNNVPALSFNSPESYSIYFKYRKKQSSQQMSSREVKKSIDLPNQHFKPT